jgi:membrane protein required for colicin V production
MNWLDILLLIIIAASVAGSFRKGLSREIIGLASVVVALLLACWFYAYAGSYLPLRISRHAANFIGFALVFAAVIAVGHAVSYVVGRFLKITGLSFFDHLLGAAFGAARGALISVALIMAIMAFSSDHQPDSVKKSRIAPYAVEVARAFAAVAPNELKEGFRKSYRDVKAAWEGAVKRESRVSGSEELRWRSQTTGRGACAAMQSEQRANRVGQAFWPVWPFFPSLTDPGWNQNKNERQV